MFAITDKCSAFSPTADAKMNANATKAAHVTAALDSKARKAKADLRTVFGKER
jgi:hypothetical protein